MGRQPDPNRARRGTGHRRAVGEPVPLGDVITDLEIAKIVEKEVAKSKAAPKKKAPAKKAAASTSKDVVQAEPAAIEPANPFAPPADLPAAVHDMWNTVVNELAARGIRQSDLEGVRIMVMAAHRSRQASAFIEEWGLMVETERGPQPNPMLKIEKDQAATFLRYAEAFGLTLSARLRLGLMQLAGQSLLASLNDDLDGGM